MTTFDPAAYGPVIAGLLHERRLSPLDAGSPDRLFLRQLEELGDDRDFAPHPVRDPIMADACRAGLWLYHEFLDEAHELSQKLHTPAGSYWHALVHRREPDYDNARYWFRQVGQHPIFASLQADAAALSAGEQHPSAAFLRSQRDWNPSAFIDLCEACLAGRSPCTLLCRRIQMREWEWLFDHCFRRAVGLPD